MNWFVKIILALLCFFGLMKFSFANQVDDGFYVGVDPTKMNNKIGNANNAVSVDSKVEEDRYYGYKFSEAGFFVSPEVSMQSSTTLSTNSNSESNNSNSSSNNSIAPGVVYNVRANVGYEFDKSFSGFITYDVGSFSYSQNQRNIGIGANNLFSSSIGVGSQVNISNNFGVKFSYSQQQFENSAAAGGQVRSDVVKVGTVYSF